MVDLGEDEEKFQQFMTPITSKTQSQVRLNKLQVYYNKSMNTVILSLFVFTSDAMTTVAKRLITGERNAFQVEETKVCFKGL